MSTHHNHGHLHRHPKPDIADAPCTEYQVMTQALEELLMAQGVFTADGMQQGVERMAVASPANGARLVAPCWIDSAFEARVLRSVKDATIKLGLALGPCRFMR